MQKNWHREIAQIQIIPAYQSLAGFITIVSDDIFKLIKQSYLDINMEQEKRTFHYERPKHEQSPLRAEQSNLSSDTSQKEQSSNA